MKKQEAYPLQYWDKKEEKKEELPTVTEEVVVKATSIVTQREALNHDYKIYLKNRGHNQLICYYAAAANFANQMKNSRGSDHKKLATSKYNEALKEIFMYENEHELLTVRDEYVFKSVNN